MFDLQPRVHLQKVKVPRTVNDELHGPGTGIPHRLGQSAGLFAHRRPRRRIQKRAGRFLDHLLISALDAAFAFMQVNTIAMAVGQNLNLDMPWLRDKLFNKHPVITKRRRRLVL